MKMKKYVFAFLSVVMLITSFTVLGDDNIGKTLDEKFPKVRNYVEGTFKDLYKDAWYYRSVVSVYELGFINGMSETVFEPDDSITVSQGITITSRMHNLYNGGNGEFTQGELWYQVYVDYAIENKIVTVNQFDSFTRELKRHEMASLFASVFPSERYEPINEMDKIPDIDKTEPYHDDVLMLYKAGIFLGNDEYGTFYPNHSIKRSEISAMINRLALSENRLYKTWS